MYVPQVVSALQKAYDSQVPINLSKLKQDISKKHKLRFMPKIVDIIAAVPDDYKDKLLPYIKAKVSEHNSMCVCLCVLYAIYTICILLTMITYTHQIHHTRAHTCTRTHHVHMHTYKL